MKNNSLPNKILLTLLDGASRLGYEYKTMKLESPVRGITKIQNYYMSLSRLKQRGYIKQTGNNYYLTLQGKELAQHLLVRQALKIKNRHWDKQWRMVCFDIPEKLRRERAALRNFLYRSGFRKLQESVWLTPYDIIKEALGIWKELGLTPYIHTALIKSLDNDIEFKKLFKLN